MNRQYSPVLQKPKKTKEDQITADFSLVQRVLEYDQTVKKNQLKKAFDYIKRIKWCLKDFSNGIYFFYQTYKLRDDKLPDADLRKDIAGKIRDLFPLVKAFDFKNNLFVKD